MRSLTVSICSYQRRDQLVTQLASIASLVRDEPEAWADAEVLVVLDGSTDGSEKAVESIDLGLTLRVHWQPNAGLASARNAALERARGEIVWLLDDDLIPVRGTVTRHRRHHEAGPPSLLLGPCEIPADLPVPPGTRVWWDERHRSLARAGRIERFDQVAMANVSCPVGLLRDIGGFDAAFVGYGMEDNEIGARLLAAGTEFLFDPEAAVWHHMTVTDEQTFRRERSIGLGASALVRAHPELSSADFPRPALTRTVRLLERLPASGPIEWRVARIAYRAGNVLPRTSPRLADRLHAVAWDAAYRSGVLAPSDPTRSPVTRALAGLQRWSRKAPYRLAGCRHRLDSDSEVALTFDDGPDPVFTPQVLAVLAQHGVRATFFLVGERASRHPDLVRQIVAGNHAIGAHSSAHLNLTALSTLGALRQIRDGHRSVAAASGQPVRLFRPPQGELNLRSALACRMARCRIYLWSRGGSDWRPGIDAASVAAEFAEVQGGDVLLMHDAIADHDADPSQSDRSATVAALADVISTVKAKGLAFVALD
ncbi:MAG TPA: polysaccharide deacetylase family protein [Acidimicrobiales bacterium]|nr:polysaccharide deacetylase family protein [Acidimicrobiales bacterium]